MQPLPFGENGVCKRKEKSTAGAAKRASGDRLFFLKCAEGLAPKPCARDRHRMAETPKAARGAKRVEPGPKGAPVIQETLKWLS